MRQPAQIKEWMSLEELQDWIREAPDQVAYKKRMAVWLTIIGPFYAHEIATMLGVAKQSVWLWISEYNKNGPKSFVSEGRGGRRWAYLSHEQEETILATFLKNAEEGQIITVKQMLPEIQKKTGKKVSLGYVYKLLKRHNWRKLGPRPHHIKRDINKQEDFKKKFL